MKESRLFLIIIILGAALFSCAQETVSGWSIISGYEANYFGNNVNLQTRYTIKNKHLLDAGLAYNISDGFANNPVLGLDLDYAYKVVNENKLSSSLGISYRRQKPLEIVNIQLINLTHAIQYKFTKNFSVLSTMGYGVAVERSASSRQFSQFNSLSGSFSLRCVYQL